MRPMADKKVRTNDKKTEVAMLYFTDDISVEMSVLLENLKLSGLIRSFFKNWDKIHAELLSSDIALRLNSLSRQTNERREAGSSLMLRMKANDRTTALVV
mmetsp:Transcript_7112/g.16288  ORF Transcript_7112/g.16288 Transcript_7112/m.16288 type:complete len:100 (-) Transcript_7112:599-898(-)